MPLQSKRQLLRGLGTALTGGATIGLYITILAVALLAGCASPEPVQYSGLSSSGQLAVNPQNRNGRVPYRYSTQPNWRQYERIIIEPVTIYRGTDNQFGDMSEDDKATLALYLQNRFAERLRTRFALASASGPRTLRLKLTLTGAETNTPVAGTLSRFDIAGGLYNGVQAVRGREGTLTGAVIYAVELYDAATDQLLSAQVSKQYPRAFDIGSSIGSLAAAKTGIDKGADALLEELN